METGPNVPTHSSRALQEDVTTHNEGLLISHCCNIPHSTEYQNKHDTIVDSDTDTLWNEDRLPFGEKGLAAAPSLADNTPERENTGMMKLLS